MVFDVTETRILDSVFASPFCTMLADFKLTSCATHKVMRRKYILVAHLSAISHPIRLSGLQTHLMAQV